MTCLLSGCADPAPAQYFIGEDALPAPLQTLELAALPGDLAQGERDRLALGLVWLGFQASALPQLLVDFPDPLTAPGLSQALAPLEPGWRATLTLADGGSSWQMSLCPAAAPGADDPPGAERGPCRDFAHPAADDPSSLQPVLIELGAALERAIPRGLDETWARPTSSDPYAVTILGRAAATAIGLREPVADEARDDSRRDPLARAPFLDPQMPLAQWLRAAHLVERRPREARGALELALRQRPRHPLLLAGAAELRAREGSGLAAGLWQQLGLVAPRDERFSYARARYAADAGQQDIAAALLEHGLVMRPQEERWLSLSAELADRAADPPARLAALQVWSARRPDDTDPVFRLLALHTEAGRLQQARALADRLPDSPETLRLRAALAHSQGDTHQALELARSAGAADLEEVLRRWSERPGEAPRLADWRRDLEALEASLEQARALGEAVGVLHQERALSAPSDIPCAPLPTARAHAASALGRRWIEALESSRALRGGLAVMRRQPTLAPLSLPADDERLRVASDALDARLGLFFARRSFQQRWLAPLIRDCPAPSFSAPGAPLPEVPERPGRWLALVAAEPGVWCSGGTAQPLEAGAFLLPAESVGCVDDAPACDCAPARLLPGAWLVPGSADGRAQVSEAQGEELPQLDPHRVDQQPQGALHD